MTVKCRFLTAVFLSLALTLSADSFIRGQDGQLRSLSTEDENYGFSMKSTNVNSVYVVSEEGMTLRMYDEQNRVKRETRWSADFSKIEAVFEYFYTEKKTTPSSKTEKYPSLSKEIEIEYNSSGVEEKRVIYKTNGSRREVVETVTWEYDSRGRIAEEKHLSGDNPPSEDKYAYLYNDNDLPPDYYVYKDGVLLEKTAYVSVSEYWSVIYFGNYEVWTRYEYGEKKEELYKLNGVIQRRSTF